jgi:hypothetical protein
LEGYWRLTFMMLDADVVAASSASVYRVLEAAGGFWSGIMASPRNKVFVSASENHDGGSVICSDSFGGLPH